MIWSSLDRPGPSSAPAGAELGGPGDCLSLRSDYEDRAELVVSAESAYPDVTPAPRVRIVEMGAHLQRLGVHLEFQPSLTNFEYARIAGSGFSIGKVAALTRGALRSSVMTKRSGGMLTLVHRLRSLLPTPNDDAPLDIYDFDDALYLRSSRRHNDGFSGFKREAFRSVRYMRNARLVLAGNRVLADVARNHASRVEIVPSCVDPNVQEIRAHRDLDVLTLGWIGSPTTSEYLRPVLNVIGSLQGRGRPIRLTLMGATPSWRAPWIEHRRWSVEAERRMLAEVDIGLMPLPDDPWARGKCGYKLLRYFSASLPTIVSPVGVASDLIADGRGLAARSEAEWARAIQELGRDVASRARIGNEARSFVEREYSYDVWAPRVAGLFRDLAAS